MYGKPSEKFITQKPPYIMTQGRPLSPSGAGQLRSCYHSLRSCDHSLSDCHCDHTEFSFDSGRFVAMDVPDDTNSITSTTSAGVAVGNLLVIFYVVNHFVNMQCGAVSVCLCMCSCICVFACVCVYRDNV